MENSSFDDDSDALSEGSDLQLFSEHEFSSDTDSDDDTQQTESSMEPDIQQTEATDDDFWSYDLHPVDIAPFTEQVGPDHTLLPDDDLLKYFYLMVNEDFFETAAQETNRYAEQEMTRKGSRDSNWYPITSPEMKAFFGINIIMGINQLPRIDMYWSENPYVGNEGFKKFMTRTRFEKLLQYLHITDNHAQAPAGSPNYDRYFTSIPLPQTLESYGVYGCGTMMANRKGFPSQLKNSHLPERGDAEQMQHNNLVATVWNDAKPVHIASTTSDLSRRWPSSKKDSGWWCHHHSVPACS